MHSRSKYHSPFRIDRHHVRGVEEHADTFHVADLSGRDPESAAGGLYSQSGHDASVNPPGTAP